MMAILAITRLTCKSAIRSHIFQLLLVVLATSVLVLPNTIAGDGTAWGFIQVSLKYSLGIIGFILALSSVWLGCLAMTSDVETYQLHMVVAKSVPRAQIWLGKWLGVVVINATLLVISTAIVYALVLWQYHRQDFSREEKARIDGEVMVGRRVFTPTLPEIDEFARREYEARVVAAREHGGAVEHSPEEIARQLGEIRKQFTVRLGEVRPGPRHSKYWTFEGVSSPVDSPLFLRYRPFVGSVTNRDQRSSVGQWMVEMMVPEQVGDEGEEVLRRRSALKSEYPEMIQCGVFSEFGVLPNVIQPDGRVVVAFTNYDPEGQTLHFQVADGPTLLARHTGFLANYARAVSLLLLKILFLSGLSCAAASFLSMPTAIFTVFSYIAFGSFASALVGSYHESLASGMAAAQIDFTERFGAAVGGLLLWIIIPIQSFSVSDKVSGGELIELSYVGMTFLEIFILRGLPFFLFGVWMYWRRELGLVVRR